MLTTARITQSVTDGRMSVEHLCKDTDKGRTKVTGEKSVPVPLRPIPISLGLVSKWTRASTVRNPRLTDRPSHTETWYFITNSAFHWNRRLQLPQQTQLSVPPSLPPTATSDVQNTSTQKCKSFRFHNEMKLMYYLAAWDLLCCLSANKKSD